MVDINIVWAKIHVRVTAPNSKNAKIGIRSGSRIQIICFEGRLCPEPFLSPWNSIKSLREACFAS